jgi:hypothetical protein
MIHISQASMIVIEYHYLDVSRDDEMGCCFGWICCLYGRSLAKWSKFWVSSQPLIQLIMNHISKARMKVIDYYHLDVSRDDEFVQG